MLNTQKNLSLKILLGTVLITAIVISYGWLPAVASDDHDRARDLKTQGEIISLSELISNAGLQEVTVLEAELEREHGKLVYELEFLDSEGRVFEQDFDAITGEPLTEPGRD